MTMNKKSVTEQKKFFENWRKLTEKRIDNRNN